MSQKIPLTQQLQRAEQRVRKEILWFSQHPSPRWSELHYVHATKAREAIIERDRLRQMIRERHAGVEE